MVEENRITKKGDWNWSITDYKNKRTYYKDAKPVKLFPQTRYNMFKKKRGR